MSDEWDAKAREIQAALVEIISLVQDVYDVDIQKSAPALTAILNEADTAAERRGIERAAKVADAKAAEAEARMEGTPRGRAFDFDDATSDAASEIAATIRALAQPAGAKGEDDVAG